MLYEVDNETVNTDTFSIQFDSSLNLLVANLKSIHFIFSQLNVSFLFYFDGQPKAPLFQQKAAK